MFRPHLTSSVPSASQPRPTCDLSWWQRWQERCVARGTRRRRRSASAVWPPSRLQRSLANCRRHNAKPVARHPQQHRLLDSLARPPQSNYCTEILPLFTSSSDTHLFCLTSFFTSVKTTSFAELAIRVAAFPFNLEQTKYGCA